MIRHPPRSPLERSSAASDVSKRQDLKAAEAQVRAAQAVVAWVQAQGRPPISVSAGPTWAETDRVAVNGGVIGVTVNPPIFSGLHTTYRVPAAEAQVDAKAGQLDRLRNQVTLDVWKAYQRPPTPPQTPKKNLPLVAAAQQPRHTAP